MLQLEQIDVLNARGLPHPVQADMDDFWAEKGLGNDWYYYPVSLEYFEEWGHEEDFPHLIQYMEEVLCLTKNQKIYLHMDW